MDDSVADGPKRRSVSMWEAPSKTTRILKSNTSLAHLNRRKRANAFYGDFLGIQRDKGRWDSLVLEEQIRMAMEKGFLCGSCKEAVLEERNDFIKAHRKLWHKACFTCKVCKNSLFFSDTHSKGCDEDIVEAGVDIDGTLYHEACFECNKCQLLIVSGSEFISVDDHNYHIDCFSCSTCESCIGRNEFIKKLPGTYMCANCFHEADKTPFEASIEKESFNRPRASSRLEKDKKSGWLKRRVTKFTLDIREDMFKLANRTFQKSASDGDACKEENKRLQKQVKQIQKIIALTVEENEILKRKFVTVEADLKVLIEENKALNQEIQRRTNKGNESSVTA